MRAGRGDRTSVIALQVGGPMPPNHDIGDKGYQLIAAHLFLGQHQPHWQRTSGFKSCELFGNQVAIFQFHDMQRRFYGLYRDLSSCNNGLRSPSLHQ